MPFKLVPIREIASESPAKIFAIKVSMNWAAKGWLSGNAPWKPWCESKLPSQNGSGLVNWTKGHGLATRVSFWNQDFANEHLQVLVGSKFHNSWDIQNEFALHTACDYKNWLNRSILASPRDHFAALFVSVISVGTSLCLIEIRVLV